MLKNDEIKLSKKDLEDYVEALDVAEKIWEEDKRKRRKKKQEEK